MKCRYEQHYVENSGLCHGCGKPMNFDYWLGSIGPEAYRNPDKYRDEWKKMEEDFENGS